MTEYSLSQIYLFLEEMLLLLCQQLDSLILSKRAPFEVANVPWCDAILPPFPFFLFPFSLGWWITYTQCWSLVQRNIKCSHTFSSWRTFFPQRMRKGLLLTKFIQRTKTLILILHILHIKSWARHFLNILVMKIQKQTWPYLHLWNIH